MTHASYPSAYDSSHFVGNTMGISHKGGKRYNKTKRNTTKSTKSRKSIKSRKSSRKSRKSRK